MEQPIKNQRKKLVISFSGCSKDDKDKRDKTNSTDRIGMYKALYGMRSCSGHSEEYVSQLSYKF